MKKQNEDIKKTGGTTNTSHEEECEERSRTEVDLWTEELTLTKTERRKLAKLEEWYRTSLGIMQINSERDQPGGITSHQEGEDKPVTKLNRNVTTLRSLRSCSCSMMTSSLETDQPPGRSIQPEGTSEQAVNITRPHWGHVAAVG